MMQFRRDYPIAIRLLFILGSVTMAAGIGHFFEAFMSGHLLFLFLSAVFITSLYCGQTAGILCGLIAAEVHNYYFQSPKYSLWVHSSEDLFQLVLFLGVSLLISWLSSSISRSYKVAETARLEAESAGRAREDLIAIVSHDLKNPLSAIKMNAELILKIRPSPETERMLRQSAQQIQNSADRMERLVRDLLDYEKIRIGTFDVQTEPQSVQSILTETLEMISPIAQNKLIRLVVPPVSRELVADCDRDRILQVLSNLLGNAVKFTNEGGEIRIEVSETAEQILFSIKDTGPGIPKNQLSRIFDRYWQAQQTARLGTGLGLSIVKGIIEAHRGRVWVDSVIGVGTTFYFNLRRAQSRALTGLSTGDSSSSRPSAAHQMQ